MKKLFSWLGTGLLLLSAELPAQPIFQQYYQWSGTFTDVDHGTYKKVKTWMNGATPYHFAVGGANNPTNDNPLPSFSCIDGNTGAIIFTKVITSPFPATEKFEAVSVALNETGINPEIAVLCNHSDPSGVTEALLYEFDVNGFLLDAIDLGPGIAVDVAYNAFVSNFNVLCEVKGPNGGTDFEMTALATSGLLPLWTRTFNWGNDKPAALVIDNGDIVAAGYTDLGPDRQILMVRLNSSGGWFWGQAFGRPNKRETITDVVFYFNIDQVFRYGFCGYDETTGQALIGDVARSGPQAGWSERYITSIDGLPHQTKATAIARTDDKLYICGMVDNNAPFIATFMKNNLVTPIDFRYYDDNENEREELNDIYWNFGQPTVVSVGAERATLGPITQDYSWITTQTPLAPGNCSRLATAPTTRFTGSTPAVFTSTDEGETLEKFTGNTIRVAGLPYDNCLTRARLAAPGTAPAAEKVPAIFPNPASDVVYLDVTLAEGESATLHIIDLSGRIIREQQLDAGTTRHLVNVKSLADGVYYWSVIVNGAPVRSDRMIIAH